MFRTPPRPLPRWLVRALPWIYLTGGVALVPWALYLALTLPADYATDHYRGTWVVFDVGLAAALASVGWCAFRRSPAIIIALSVAAAMLFTDAWFDVSSARGADDHRQALLSALLLEIPGGLVCLRLAHRALFRVLAAGGLVDVPTDQDTAAGHVEP
ncbi:hypothetical protein [Nocardioides jiangxiensis]|uniref:Uncharacterized protein n=1 Tax=Nocardioides jiangxiensis TaxID=3064524 RepID=A0ABT9B7P0_9ACTN|nr:hypothetical protein [Nocardioides sp. WY-20]MDO7869597.1 hypothetical protein [Nocardioides sp. WY-20]